MLQSMTQKMRLLIPVRHMSLMFTCFGIEILRNQSLIITDNIKFGDFDLLPWSTATTLIQNQRMCIKSDVTSAIASDLFFPQ